MPVQSSFSDTEWTEIVQSSMLASLAITAADPGGLWGAVQEAGAAAKSMLAARDAPEGSLLAEIAVSFESSDGRSAARASIKDFATGKTAPELADAAVEKLGETSRLVAAKAPDQSRAFNSWIYETAEAVAEAGTEGGFLGFGGVKVSDAEKKTLADLARVLG
jgi:hypothetical protein